MTVTSASSFVDVFTRAWLNWSVYGEEEGRDER